VSQGLKLWGAKTLNENSAGSRNPACAGHGVKHSQRARTHRHLSPLRVGRKGRIRERIFEGGKPSQKSTSGRVVSGKAWGSFGGDSPSDLWDPTSGGGAKTPPPKCDSSVEGEKKRIPNLRRILRSGVSWSCLVGVPSLRSLTK